MRRPTTKIINIAKADRSLPKAPGTVGPAVSIKKKIRLKNHGRRPVGVR